MFPDNSNNQPPAQPDMPDASASPAQLPPGLPGGQPGPSPIPGLGAQGAPLPDMPNVAGPGPGGMPSVPGMGVQGAPSPPPPNPMQALQQQMEQWRKESAERRKQHEQFLQQVLSTNGLEQFLPKPSAKQMLSDAMTNFGMARLTGGNFTPIQTHRFDEAFRRHAAAAQNAQLLLQNDRQDEVTAANMQNEMLKFQQLAERQQNDEGRRDLTGQGMDLKKQLAMMHTNAIAGTMPGSSLKALMPNDSLGSPIDESGAYHAIRDAKNQVIAAYPASQAAGKLESDWFKDPTSSSGYTHARMKQDGTVAFAVKNVTPPAALLPTISQTMKFVPQPDGSTMAVPVETTRSKANGTAADGGMEVVKPGAAPTPTPPVTTSPAKTPPRGTTLPPTGSAPPAAQKPTSFKMAAATIYDDSGKLRMPAYSGSGPVHPGQTVGGRALPPQARMGFEATAQAMDMTSERLTTILKAMPRLQSLIDAGKLQLATNPTGLAVISRAYGLSPEDEKVAAAMTNLAEDINVLRKPFNATGFRGPEAFAALQSQRGNWMARPGVMKETIIGTIKALQGQRKAIDKGLANGEQPRIHASSAANYAAIAKAELGDTAAPEAIAAKAKQMAVTDGYKVD